jgi:hypothetical protein
MLPSERDREGFIAATVHKTNQGVVYGSDCSSLKLLAQERAEAPLSLSLAP